MSADEGATGPAAPDGVEPWPAWCERTPASGRPADLGFRPQPMVSWLAPRPLVRTGLRTVLSDVFGAYADKRETHAALDAPSVQLEDAFLFRYADAEGRPTASDGLWFDYAADVGDGFSPTYAVAALLGQASLRPDPPADPRVQIRLRNRSATPAAVLDRSAAGQPTAQAQASAQAQATALAAATQRGLPRGRFLVLGGDQVYPYASRHQYRERFAKPYTAALPGVEHDPPDLYAIPGNHDWYDGLTSFSRQFFQDRSVGAWRTRQRRSYFALKLPHRWWLWGIDIQLEADVDGPQLAYFARVAERLRPGDRVVLCTATPAWAKSPSEFRTLSFFLEKMVLDRGAEPSVLVSGDTHHYYRYEGRGGQRQLLTAGGGGAYLAATHRRRRADRLPLRLRAGAPPEDHVPKACYPSEQDSRRLRLGALAFPFKNPAFALTLGGAFLLLALVLQAASAELAAPLLLTELARAATVPAAAGAFARVATQSLAAMASLAAVLLFGFVLMETKETWKRVVVGATLGAANVALLCAVVWGAAAFNARVLGVLPNGTPAEVALFSAAFVVGVVLVGGLAGGLLMGSHLVLSNVLFGMNANLVFVAQRIQDRKCFLRFHVAEDGVLTIFPLGVHRVPRRWWFNRNAKGGMRWFEPTKGHLRAHLIEAPIVLAPTTPAEAPPVARFVPRTRPVAPVAAPPAPGDPMAPTTPAARVPSSVPAVAAAPDAPAPPRHRKVAP